MNRLQAPAFPEEDDLQTLRDRLTGALIGIARATEGNEYMLSDATAAIVTEGLRATAGTGADRDTLCHLLRRAEEEKRRLVPECFRCAASCGRTNDYDLESLRGAAPEVRHIKYRIFSGLCQAAQGEAECALFYRALYAVGMDDWETEELLPIAREVEEAAGRMTAKT